MAVPEAYGSIPQWSLPVWRRVRRMRRDCSGGRRIPVLVHSPFFLTVHGLARCRRMGPTPDRFLCFARKACFLSERRNRLLLHFPGEGGGSGQGFSVGASGRGEPAGSGKGGASRTGNVPAPRGRMVFSGSSCRGRSCFPVRADQPSVRNGVCMDRVSSPYPGE